MSGHSKWATIRRKKGEKDAKRGKIFSKLAKVISLSAKNGGDPDMNPSLRVAIDQAKAQGMPKDNIERAIRKGTGEDGDVSYEEVQYEGLGPAGVQVIVNALTDNRNRTISELRKLFEVKGGKLGSPNSVSWNFEVKGHIELSSSTISEEELFELVVDAGAEDLQKENDTFSVYSSPDDLDAIKKAIEGKELVISTYEIVHMPKSTVAVKDKNTAQKVVNMISALEEHDDVQSVSANFDIPDEVLQELS